MTCLFCIPSMASYHTSLLLKDAWKLRLVTDHGGKKKRDISSNKQADRRQCYIWNYWGLLWRKTLERKEKGWSKQRSLKQTFIPTPSPFAKKRKLPTTACERKDWSFLSVRKITTSHPDTEHTDYKLQIEVLPFPRIWPTGHWNCDYLHFPSNAAGRCSYKHHLYNKTLLL